VSSTLGPRPSLTKKGAWHDRAQGCLLQDGARQHRGDEPSDDARRTKRNERECAAPSQVWRSLPQNSPKQHHPTKAALSRGWCSLSQNSARQHGESSPGRNWARCFLSQQRTSVHTGESATKERGVFLARGVQRNQREGSAGKERGRDFLRLPGVWSSVRRARTEHLGGDQGDQCKE
jgi:hypothetical protein